MSTATETKQGRKTRRKTVTTATFMKRLTMEEGSVLRVTVTDTSEGGIGLVSVIPMRVGDRVAIGLTLPSAAPEILLSRVQHCGKNASGQYRFGVSVLERHAGDLVKMRVPAAWLVQAN